MKKVYLAIFLIISMLICSCSGGMPAQTAPCQQHADENTDGICDVCRNSVWVYVDFYAVNDLHGKLADGENHPGVDELTTYLKNARETDTHMILLSAGDMWQGSAESNMTKGLIMTDWMNELDFNAMTIGNHEFDWGEEYIGENDAYAEFPFLAINIYDWETDALADYCQASVVVQSGPLQIGIIGAIGDCYSSIAVDKCEGVYFKTGSELTALVKAESQRLRDQGVDFVVYLLHDGYGSTRTGGVVSVTGPQIRSYYDTALSNGYVDLVFEGHTHQGYRLRDEYGVYHLQNRGDNKGGISHVEVAINTVTNASSIRVAELVSTETYEMLADDPVVEDLMEKYAEEIAPSNRVVGDNSSDRGGNAMRQLVADLYYEAGMEKWAEAYDIVLGGGYISIRSPGYLARGAVTYAQLQSLFPFDNELTLCSVTGRDLWANFLATDNDNYFISYGVYGADVYDNIDMDATYYIVVDTYSALYAPNRLTVVEEYGDGIFARDLLAAYIGKGGLAG